MNLEIRHLKLVTAIVDHGGVTSAANQLNLTQSALSHQLRDIEKRLGAPLFQRLSRRMVLTPAGERLLESARNVLSELAAVEQEIADSSTQREGILRISTECYTCYHWLPERLKQFHAKHPRIEVRIVASATRKPFEALFEGKLDVGIVSSSVRNRKLRYTPIFQDELVVLTRPDHPLASRSYIRAEDFAGEHLITYNVPKEQLTVYQRVLNPARVAPRDLSQIELTEAILEMVKAGLGISVMAQWAARPYLDSGALTGIRLTRTGIQRTWSAATLRNSFELPYLAEFIKVLRAKPAIEPGKLQSRKARIGA